MSTPAQYDPYPGPSSSILDLSDERDLWLKRLHDAERAAYQRGYADGQADAKRDDDAEFAAIRPQGIRGGLTYTALQWRRWGPGGRERFGDPRPGDFPGRDS